MIFWIAALTLAAIAAVAVLWPLRSRQDDALERSAGALAIFTDQLAEVDRDAERGLISATEAEAAKLEIKRRMLATDKDKATTRSAGGTTLLVIMAALIPLGGALVYTVTGAPGTPSIPFAERVEEQQTASDLAVLTQRLETRLNAEPDGGETRGWELLATTFMNMGRFGDAVRAWEQVIDRADATSATWSQYAEALIAAEQGVVTPKAERAVERALEMDALNPAGTYYKALAMEQAGQTPAARQMILDRIAAEGAPQPWMEVFLREANRMGAEFGLDPVGLPAFDTAPRGPSAEDVEAAQAMSPEDRMAFIRSMVDGLAARMQDEPGNLDGWLQLARAYMVLGERENAQSALESAQPLVETLPADDARRQIVQQALQDLAGD